MPRTTSLLPWALGCAAMGMIFAAGLAVDLTREVVVCHAGLDVVAEPEGWRDWPVVPDLGGYRVEGLRPFNRPPPRMQDATLRDASLCPLDGISLDRWFKDQAGAFWARSGGDLQLHAKEGVLVVSGSDGYRTAVASPQSEVFVAAFKRDDGERPGFRTWLGEWIALALVAGLVGVIRQAGLARRALITARGYGDPARYKAGVRRESGAVDFDADTVPMAPSARTAGPPGPVLVEAPVAGRWTFRRAAPTEARRVIAGDRSALIAAARADAALQLRRGGVWACFVLGVGVVTPSCVVMVVEFARSISFS